MKAEQEPEQTTKEEEDRFKSDKIDQHTSESPISDPIKTLEAEISNRLNDPKTSVSHESKPPEPAVILKTEGCLENLSTEEKDIEKVQILDKNTSMNTQSDATKTMQPDQSGVSNGSNDTGIFLPSASKSSQPAISLQENQESGAKTNEEEAAKEDEIFDPQTSVKSVSDAIKSFQPGGAKPPKTWQYNQKATPYRPKSVKPMVSLRENQESGSKTNEEKKTEGNAIVDQTTTVKSVSHAIKAFQPEEKQVPSVIYDPKTSVSSVLSAVSAFETDLRPVKPSKKAPVVINQHKKDESYKTDFEKQFPIKLKESAKINEHKKETTYKTDFQKQFPIKLEKSVKTNAHKEQTSYMTDFQKQFQIKLKPLSPGAKPKAIKDESEIDLASQNKDTEDTENKEKNNPEENAVESKEVIIENAEVEGVEDLSMKDEQVDLILEGDNVVTEEIQHATTAEGEDGGVEEKKDEAVVPVKSHSESLPLTKDHDEVAVVKDELSAPTVVKQKTSPVPENAAMVGSAEAKVKSEKNVNPQAFSEMHNYIASVPTKARDTAVDQASKSCKACSIM